MHVQLPAILVPILLLFAGFAGSGSVSLEQASAQALPTADPAGTFSPASSGVIGPVPAADLTGVLFPGYILFTPRADGISRLMDADQNVVHQWDNSSYQPGNMAYLRPDGHLIRTGQDSSTPYLGGCCGGGFLEEFDWDGNLVWNFTWSNETHLAHHDIALLPNGNILMLAYEWMDFADAVAAGRDPTTMQPTGISLDSVIEVEPTPPSGGNIVWEWHVGDHLIQDFDPGQANYGVVGDNPQLLDINFRRNQAIDWLHTNGIGYDPVLDQIVVSTYTLSELWVIDHSTNTTEAASHSGGNAGMGGDILYRWGNPQSYRAGTALNMTNFGSHDPQWIPPGSPGAGNILFFNNGRDRSAPKFSTVDEIVTPVLPNGSYAITPGEAFAPDTAVWQYPAVANTSFYASKTSGAQRLPNGNTLITEGPAGRIFEVDDAGNLLFEYDHPTSVFKARKYPADWPIFSSLWDRYSMVAGWNLISLPTAMINESAAEVLGRIDGGWTSAWAYDPSTGWSSYSVGRPAYQQTLVSIDQTMGWWLNASSANTSVPRVGTVPPSTTIPLQTGWNLVGYPAETPRTLDQALAGTGWDAAQGFNVTSPYRMESLNGTDVMSAGLGYWVHVPADTVWTVTS